jgi:hypothetical protein
MYIRNIIAAYARRGFRLLLVTLVLAATLAQAYQPVFASPALPPLIVRLQVPMQLDCLSGSRTPTQRLVLAQHHLCGYHLSSSGVPTPEGPGVPITSNCGTLQLGIYNNGGYSALWIFDVYPILPMVGVTYSGYWYNSNTNQLWPSVGGQRGMWPTGPM